jgi:hypothetical protein
MKPELYKLIWTINKRPLWSQRLLSRPLNSKVLQQLADDNLDLEVSKPLSNAHSRTVAKP